METETTNPSAPTKISAKEIRIERAEGRSDECIEVKVRTFAEANRILRSWAHTAPKGGGYDKCDFTVTYEDDNTYGGRFDLEYDHCTMTDMLQNHMRAHLTFLAGTGKPGHMTEEQYRKYLATERVAKYGDESREFLAGYKLSD